MSNVNRIFLVGRLTADPEARTTNGGTAMTKFTLAVDRPVRSDGANAADFIPVVAWSDLAEICGKYLKKGRLISIGGRVQVRKYQNAEQVTIYATEVIASEMKMLDKSGAASNATPMADEYASSGGNAAELESEAVLVEDDIPF